MSKYGNAFMMYNVDQLIIRLDTVFVFFMCNVEINVPFFPPNMSLCYWCSELEGGRDSKKSDLERN